MGCHICYTPFRDCQENFPTGPPLPVMLENIIFLHDSIRNFIHFEFPDQIVLEKQVDRQVFQSMFVRVALDSVNVEVPFIDAILDAALIHGTMATNDTSMTLENAGGIFIAALTFDFLNILNEYSVLDNSLVFIS